ncbi:helix-turn-helix domain-containing protein [Spirillospora sp. CA-255316]
MGEQAVPALSRTCCPGETRCPRESRCAGDLAGAVLWLWPGQALYAGPSLDLDVHAGSVACLAVGVDGPVTVEVPGREPLAGRTVLVPPRLPHRLVASGGRMVFCYLDPASAHAHACAARMAETGAAVRHGHRDEDRLIRLGARLRHCPAPTAGARWLRAAAPAPAPAGGADRIRAATRRLLDRPGSAVSAADLAASAGLSVSRFLHLFKEQTGTSFRRYRLWARILRAGDLVAAGHDLTTVAAESGFATPSHLSGAFHAMFGLAPSQLLAVGLTIVRGGPGGPRGPRSGGGGQGAGRPGPAGTGGAHEVGGQLGGEGLQHDDQGLGEDGGDDLGH